MSSLFDKMAEYLYHDQRASSLLVQSQSLRRKEFKGCSPELLSNQQVE